MQTAPFPAQTPLVQFRGVGKSFGRGGPVIRGFDLAVAAGEFVSILAPSGAGKTTLLLILAGLERPDEGEVLLGGAPANGVPPHARRIGAVFQDAVLFPHLTTAENIAAPLRARGVGRRERALRVAEAVRALRLDGLERCLPRQLTAGQRRRAALARALVPRPSILLLDEPLAGLDRDLRDAMLAEFRPLQRLFGVTVLHATRDPSEAMILADRIAVLADGRVQQCDAPRTLYEAPATLAAASSLGESNRMAGTVSELDEDDAVARVRLDCGPDVEAEPVDALAPGERCVVTVRPDRIALAAARAADFGADAIPARVLDVAYLGDRARIRLALGGKAPGDGGPKGGPEGGPKGGPEGGTSGAACEIVVVRPADAAAGLAAGRDVAVAWQPHHARAYKPPSPGGIG